MPEAIPANLASVLEGFDVGERVELFELDLTAQGGPVVRFTPAPVKNSEGVLVPPSFGGDVHIPFPISSEGWEWSADGPLPTPTITFRLAREDGDEVSPATALLSLVGEYDDMLGGRLTRRKTLRRHLDDGEEPDGTAVYSTEIYELEQRTALTGTHLSFLLKSGLDHEGVDLPRRRALPRCPLIYRIPDGEGGFDYSRATCPYVGEDLFDLLGGPVETVAEDRCGKNLRDCRLRFGATAELPFGGFPGVGRIES